MEWSCYCGSVRRTSCVVIVYHIVVRLVWKMERLCEVDHIFYISFTLDGKCICSEILIHSRWLESSKLVIWYADISFVWSFILILKVCWSSVSNLFFQAMMEKNQRSRMNCVVEKRRAEEIVDHQPHTIRLPFGVNLTTDPRYDSRKLTIQLRERSCKTFL